MLLKIVKEYIAEFVIVAILGLGLLYAITTTYQISLKLEQSKTREVELKQDIRDIKEALAKSDSTNNEVLIKLGVFKEVLHKREQEIKNIEKALYLISQNADEETKKNIGLILLGKRDTDNSIKTGSGSGSWCIRSGYPRKCISENTDKKYSVAAPAATAEAAAPAPAPPAFGSN